MLHIEKKIPAGMFSAYDSTQHPGSLIVFTITGRAKSPCMDWGQL